MNTKTISINGKDFVYDDESDVLECDASAAKPISAEDGQFILETAGSLFREIGVNFYLAYGTLLGAVREHNIIKGDEDVDVYTQDETALFGNLPYLASKGLKLVRYYPGKLYSFRINERCYLDVYILRPLRYCSPWSIYCYSISGFTMPKKFFRHTMDIEFLGHTYKCPAKPEKLLEFWYGKNWTVPMSAKPHVEVRSAEIFHKFCQKHIPVARIKAFLGIS